MNDPYLDQALGALPRILAAFDRDRTRASFGFGDRYHWAWGLSDFANGTAQGAAHGMAQLWTLGVWPYPMRESHFVERIGAIFSGTRTLTRRDGSLEEAFPREGSWCVTAQVAYDLCCTLELLSPLLDADERRRWCETIAPLVAYLQRHDETHALISNHLGTGVAALVRWHRLADDSPAESRARVLMNRILAAQSSEGWFREYTGADPGYQTLATSHLADVHALRPDWGLTEPLRRSLDFLWHFAHPDGSFGGLYGSRCTRFYYPAGIEQLAGEFPEAAALAARMAESVGAHRVVTLDAVGDGNLVPLFNDYCRAASIRAAAPGAAVPITIPALMNEPLRRIYPEAGLVIDRGPTHYTIVAVSKGGVVSHFVDGKQSLLDAGVVVRDARGRLASTQAHSIEHPVHIKGDRLVVDARFVRMTRALPRPWQFLVLRALSMTVFRVARWREWVKRGLVRRLITGENALAGANRRTVKLGADLSVSDETRLPPGMKRVENPGQFVAIHMASQGYWQLQDDA